jgi:predicted thioesterase
MLNQPQVGATSELRFVVEPRHAIDFADEHLPAVLSTPWLIWFLEHAARGVMAPLLSAGESTVGVLIEVRHLAATPVGGAVVCLARVLQVDGQTVSFQCEARDEHDVIARGFHKRRVIQVERFAQRVRAKASGQSGRT